MAPHSARRLYRGLIWSTVRGNLQVSIWQDSNKRAHAANVPDTAAVILRTLGSYFLSSLKMVVVISARIRGLIWNIASITRHGETFCFLVFLLVVLGVWPYSREFSILRSPLGNNLNFIFCTSSNEEPKTTDSPSPYTLFIAGDNFLIVGISRYFHLFLLVYVGTSKGIFEKCSSGNSLPCIFFFYNTPITSVRRQYTDDRASSFEQ